MTDLHDDLRALAKELERRMHEHAIAGRGEACGALSDAIHRISALLAKHEGAGRDLCGCRYGDRDSAEGHRRDCAVWGDS